MAKTSSTKPSAIVELPTPAITAPVETNHSPSPDDNPELHKSINEARNYAIASVAHMANRVLTAHAGDVPVQVPWVEYPEDLKQSAIKAIEFLANNPTTSPEEVHENWCKVKVKAGWTHNGIYDAEAKRHPHLRPYGALAPEVRLKDKMFRAIVNAMLKL